VKRDPLGPFESVVPAAIASGGVVRRSRPTGRRRDRPLGKQHADLLKGVPLFSELSRRHLRRLAERADEVEFAKGEVIVEAGARGGAFFVILSGQARVTKDGRTLARLGPGDFFGELALLDGGPRSATVTAATELIAVRIFKRAFDRLVAEEPLVGAKMLGVLAARLRAVERSLTD
jgi:CRP/FNR family transcriptional regulator, cyclic AMP receptor protein